MVNAGLIVISFVCAGLAGWNIGLKQHYKKNWKALQGEYDKRCDELTSALGEVGRLKLDNESIRKANRCLCEDNNDFRHLLHSGCRNLKAKEMKVDITGYCAIAVVGQDTRRSDLHYVIKDFPFNPYDPEDRAFAIREAEELIETINKA